MYKVYCGTGISKLKVAINHVNQAEKYIINFSEKYSFYMLDLMSNGKLDFTSEVDLHTIILCIILQI